MPVFEHELPFVTLVIVYVVVAVGLTLMEAGLLDMLFTVVELVPSLYVMLHGDTPVSATERFVETPLQIAALPEIVAVGLLLMVTVTLLLLLQPVAVIVSVNVYVVVIVGLTDGLEEVELKPDGLDAQVYVCPETDAAPMDALPPEHID